MDDTSSSPNKATPSRTDVWKMFDKIAHRYDLLNRLLSLRRDVAWRKRLATYLPDRSHQIVLDLATGTGDVLFSLFQTSKLVQAAVGMDMSPKMLQLGQRKAAQGGLGGRISFVRADAMCLPFADGSFDTVTISFGIRNVADVPKALAEMQRVLKPGGKALILEFSMPRSWLIRKLYPFYLQEIIPRLGGMISGDRYAYRYLNKTVETFPFGEQFCEMMKKAGFVGVKATPLTFGISTIYRGSKLLSLNERKVD